MLRKCSNLFASLMIAALLAGTFAGAARAVAQTSSALVLGKSANPTTYDHVGQVITYTCTIQNLGMGPIKGPFTITDDKLGSFACGGALLFLDAGWPPYPCNNPQQYTITQADMEARAVTNTAYVTSGDTQSTSDNAALTIYYSQGETGLVLGKTVVGGDYTYDHVGQVIRYSYTIQNVGSMPIAGPFTITDDRIGSFTCGGAPSALAGGGGVVTCNNPQQYAITEADVTAGSVTNTAYVLSADSIASDSVSLTVMFVATPHITLTKIGTAPAIPDVGQQIHYTFTITNDGNAPLSPPYLIYDALIGSNWACPSTPNPLPVGGAVTCTGSYALTSQDIGAGSVNNTATAAVHYGSGAVISAPASASVPIPGLYLALSASPTSATAVGQTVTYKYTLINRTTSAMTGVSVTDTRGANAMACIDTLAGGTKGSCTRDYTITQADFDSGAGYFSNSANAAAQGNIHSNKASVNVMLVQQPPTVLSVMRGSSAALTSAASAPFIVTFSKSVIGVNTTAPFSDLRLTTRGLTGADITSVIALSPMTYQVTVKRGTGSGMIHLDVLDDDSILDSAYGLPLGGAGTGNGSFMSGQAYWIVPMPQSPGGTITNRTPTFKWTRLPGVTKYHIQLVRGTAVVYSLIVPATACGTTVCTVTPPTRLPLAKYTWRVQAYAAGIWRVFSPYKAFTLKAQ